MSASLMAPKNPPINATGARHPGQTRTAGRHIQWSDPLTGVWHPAVRQHTIRQRLRAQADAQGTYLYERGQGTGDNITAFVAKDVNFGPLWADRPPVLFQLHAPKNEKIIEPTCVLRDGDRIMLDPWDHPIRDFGDDLPIIISSCVLGWEIEHYLRRNRAIRIYDIVARMENTHVKGPAVLPGPPRLLSIRERQTKFREKSGCLTWAPKGESDTIDKYIMSLLPDGATTTRVLGQDLTKQQMKMRKAKNAGRFGNRRRKSTRDAEKARAEIGKKKKKVGKDEFSDEDYTSDEDSSDSFDSNESDDKQPSEAKGGRLREQERYDACPKPGAAGLPYPRSPPDRPIDESSQNNGGREVLTRTTQDVNTKTARVRQWMDASQSATSGVTSYTPSRPALEHSDDEPEDDAPDESRRPDKRYEMPTGRQKDTIRRALNITRMDFVLSIESTGERYESAPLTHPHESYMSQYNRLQNLFEREFERVFQGRKETPTLYCLDAWSGGFGDYRVEEDDVEGQYLLGRLHEETDEYRAEQYALRSHNYTGC